MPTGPRSAGARPVPILGSVGAAFPYGTNICCSPRPRSVGTARGRPQSPAWSCGPKSRAVPWGGHCHPDSPLPPHLRVPPAPRRAAPRTHGRSIPRSVGSAVGFPRWRGDRGGRGGRVGCTAASLEIRRRNSCRRQDKRDLLSARPRTALQPQGRARRPPGAGGGPPPPHAPKRGGPGGGLAPSRGPPGAAGAKRAEGWALGGGAGGWRGGASCCSRWWLGAAWGCRPPWPHGAVSLQQDCSRRKQCPAAPGAPHPCKSPLRHPLGAQRPRQPQPSPCTPAPRAVLSFCTLLHGAAHLCTLLHTLHAAPHPTLLHSPARSCVLLHTSVLPPSPAVCTLQAPARSTCFCTSLLLPPTSTCPAHHCTPLHAPLSFAHPVHAVPCTALHAIACSTRPCTCCALAALAHRCTLHAVSQPCPLHTLHAVQALLHARCSPTQPCTPLQAPRGLPHPRPPLHTAVGAQHALSMQVPPPGCCREPGTEVGAMGRAS